MNQDILPVAQATKPEGVNITVVAKMKHAELYAAAKRLGGQAKLAKKLGINPAMAGQWIAMKSCPPAGPKGNSGLKSVLIIWKKTFSK